MSSNNTGLLKHLGNMAAPTKTAAPAARTSNPGSQPQTAAPAAQGAQTNGWFGTIGYY